MQLFMYVGYTSFKRNFIFQQRTRGIRWRGIAMPAIIRKFVTLATRHIERIVNLLATTFTISLESLTHSVLLKVRTFKAFMGLCSKGLT